MQRDTYEAVTVQILVPASTQEKEGEAYADAYDRAPVRRFTDEDINRNTSRGKLTWKQIEGWRQTQILNYVEALRAIEAGDKLALDKAYLNLKAHAGAISREVAKHLLREPGHAQVMLAHDLSGQLREVRLVLWYWKGQMIPALLCPDLATALLLRVFMSATGASAGLRLCPKCGRAFLQKRRDQDYCSVKCREAYRVARWRADRTVGLKPGSKNPKPAGGKPSKNRSKRK